jgi:pimeloyl-ACP methyl ester carboxylesterase
MTNRLTPDEDGVPFKDGRLTLPDGRTVTWRLWGEEEHSAILRLQGTPGSRLSHHPDPTLWRDLGVRMLMMDRPGFGGSTRLPGHGLRAVADDLARLLDAHGLDRAPVVAFSGGGPHALALAARHPDRVDAVTVVVGAAPFLPGERARLVGVNAAGLEAADQGWEALHRYLAGIRERVLADAGSRGVLADAPPPDRKIMADPAWQRIDRANSREALRQGAEGWTDEVLALVREWDFEPAQVQACVTWWHGSDDANAPLSAAQRVLAQVRQSQLHVWHNQGHFASITHEGAIIRELLGQIE